MPTVLITKVYRFFFYINYHTSHIFMLKKTEVLLSFFCTMQNWRNQKDLMQRAK
jgi:hypothetical protein